MLKLKERKGAASEDATDEDVGLLLNDWPSPMWDFDLGPIVVSPGDLESTKGTPETRCALARPISRPSRRSRKN